MCLQHELCRELLPIWLMLADCDCHSEAMWVVCIGGGGRVMAEGNMMGRNKGKDKAGQLVLMSGIVRCNMDLCLSLSGKQGTRDSGTSSSAKAKGAGGEASILGSWGAWELWTEQQ